eukprot:gene6230-7760_t
MSSYKIAEKQKPFKVSAILMGITVTEIHSVTVSDSAKSLKLLPSFTKVNNNTIYFIREVSEDEYTFKYEIITVLNNEIRLKESKLYYFGSAIPMDEQNIVEYQRHKSRDGMEVVQVDIWNHVRKQGKVLCMFKSIPGEVLMSIIPYVRYSKLVVHSLFQNLHVITVRSIENKSGDFILRDWAFKIGDVNNQTIDTRELYKLTTDRYTEQLVIYSPLKLIFYDMAGEDQGDQVNDPEEQENLKWSIDFHVRSKLEKEGFVKIVSKSDNGLNGTEYQEGKQLLIHFNIEKSTIYLDFYDMEMREHLRSIKLADVPKADTRSQPILKNLNYLFIILV